MKTIDYIPEIDSGKLSKPAPTAYGRYSSGRTRRDCYCKCIENTWETTSEYVCSEACSVDKS